jgi:VIT1/CCC1 family predicted Fe2+/Mn2+ transporter
MSETPDIRRYRENIQREVDNTAIYRTLAKAEEQPHLARVFGRLADVEEDHVRFWNEQLHKAGATASRPAPGWRSRVLGWLAVRFGPQLVLPTLSANERAARDEYSTQPEAAGTSLTRDEASHGRLLGIMAGPSGMEGGSLARLEGRHRAIGGNALRAAVLGVNDGLVSNLSLVMGVAGADLSGHAILITGFAGLLAGASAMAMGEWVSVTSSRELYQRQIDIEAEEIRGIPEEEAQELALIYQAKGLDEAEARQLAARLIADHDTALDTLAREELGIDPSEMGGSPLEAAVTSFALFILGAIVPLLPFAVFSGTAAVGASLLASAVGLFVIGAAITLMTGRTVLQSGGRQLLFGLAAAALTFGIGRLMGVTLGG